MEDRREAVRRVRRFLQARRVGRYRLIREIGRGGMATVYEAEDPQLRRSVALKILQGDDAQPVLVSRFHREATLAAQLRHPNIVGVHEVGLVREETGTIHYIAMDLIDGQPLSAVLADGHAPRERRLRWLEETARATAYAHEKGIIHRDIKPGNILIDRDGRALLADFGLARGDCFSVALTQTYAVLGTLGYMAPEQIAGRAREADPRADVYALGVVLYEMLAGRRPYDSETPARRYRQILEEDPAPPSKWDRTVPRDLDVVCLKAIDRNPDRRYASAAAFADDLERIRKGEAIAARPLSPLLLLWRRIVRRRAVLIPAAAALLVGGASAGWFQHGRVERSRKIREHLAAAEACEDAEAARDGFRTVLALDPDHRAARTGLAAAEERLAEREREARRRARAGQEALQEIEEARYFLEQATVQPGLRRLESQTIASLIQQALHFLESAVRKAPHLAAARLHRGRAYALQGEDDRALAEFDEALRLEASLPQAFLERGKLRLKRREWKPALADFSSVLRISPLSADGRIGRAKASYATGDLAGAIADADELVRTHAYAMQSYMLRAELLEEAGRLEEAVRDRTKILEIDRHPSALVQRGRLWQKLGKLAEAIRDYEAALASAPQSWPSRRTTERAVEDLKQGKNEPGSRTPVMILPRE